MSDLEPKLLEIAGRSHLLLVHLPIGLILAAGLIEAVGRGRTRPGARSAARWCLGLGAVAAVLGAASGWIHADHVPVSRALGSTLLLHRCGGIATALVATVTWAVSRPAGKAEGESNAYRFGLAGACALVVVTGHWGGTLVHGPNFLLGPLWDEPEAVPAQPSAPIPDDLPDALGAAVEGPADGAPASDGPRSDGPDSDGPDYGRDVRPLLAARCYDCHGERRQKGRLRLDRLEELLADGSDVIVPGDPDASELIARVVLPPDDLDVMPAEGDPLTPAEVDVLRRWIAAGAPLEAGGPGRSGGADASSPEGSAARDGGAGTGS